MTDIDDSASRAPLVPDDSHLIDLAGGWKLWRSFCVRGAGFPVRMLERLAAPEAVASIDSFISCKRVYDEVRGSTLERLRRMIQESDDVGRKPLRRVSRQVSKGRPPDPLPDFPEIAQLLDDLIRARDEQIAARCKAERSIADALASISLELRQTGRDARFREAITWQNRKALREGVDVLLRTSAGKRNKRARRHEQLIVSYLQRYCAKNETIGFFGPLGWGEWSDAGAGLVQRPGPDFVTGRRVHFEYWAIAALAQALSESPGLHEWLLPRLNPILRIEGDRLIGPQATHTSIRPEAARVLAACSGEATARDIAAGLCSNPDYGPQTADEVYAILTQAADQRLIAWDLGVPVGTNPELNLRKSLEGVGDRVLRSQLMDRLDALEAARDAVAAAAGDAEALDTAYGRLESVFTECTGESPYQHSGQVYAGRTLVYEDCRRQTQVEIGSDIRAEIGPPLALVLQSARWFSHTVAARFEDYLNRLFAELQPRFAAQAVPVSAMAFLFDKRNRVVPSIVREVAKELTARWASILSYERGARQVELSSDDLRALVSSAFAAPCPGWSGARHHSADILIAAEGPEELRSGRMHCVLGEVHVNDTMLMRQVIRELHPRPEELVEAYRRDVDQSQVFRVRSRDSRGHRKQWDPYLPGDLQLAWDNSPVLRPNDEVLRICDLIIENSANGLVVRTRDNALSFPALVYFERLLWHETLTEFKLLPPAGHCPRITIDGLVVKRESWRFACRDLDFLYEKTETERFIGARFWARSLGLPHWVFARFPQEFKPVYVDLESPASVEVMAKLARRAVELSGDTAELNLSEMLPDPTQSWLTDAQGNTYTSELRIVAVDPTSWQPVKAAM